MKPKQTDIDRARWRNRLEALGLLLLTGFYLWWQLAVLKTKL